MDKRIIFQNENGGVSIVIPMPDSKWTMEELVSSDVPAGRPYKIVDVSEIPSDRTFRNAWEFADKVQINMAKAKQIGHEMRRQAREEEFAPLDKIIMAQIPGTDLVAVEAKRQAIRDKYAAMQGQIDAASTPEQIKIALGLF